MENKIHAYDFMTDKTLCGKDTPYVKDKPGVRYRKIAWFREELGRASEAHKEDFCKRCKGKMLWTI